MTYSPHVSVLRNEAINMLAPKNNEIYIDFTFGAGGYSAAILDSANCNLIAFDRDEHVIQYADLIAEKYAKRFSFASLKFSEVEEYLEENNISEIDGCVLDLGVSSMQLDNVERGFSFQGEAIVDMSMGRTNKSVKEFLNHADEEEIANVIFAYGGEVKSRKIARKICYVRKIKPIETTLELASICKQVCGFPGKKIDPATKTFQALRIWVNEELEEIKSVLKLSAKILKKNGRIVIVSFQSLEDKIVKEYFRNNFNEGETQVKSRYMPYKEDKFYEIFKTINSKPVIAGDEELKLNPRARSAKLRGAIKINDFKEGIFNV